MFCYRLLMSSLLEELENDDLVEVESAGGSELGSLITTALSSLAAHDPSSHQPVAPLSSLGDVVILDSDTEEAGDEVAEIEEVAVEADDDDAEHPGQKPSPAADAESSVAHSPPKRARGRPRGRPVPRVEREAAVQNAEAMLADLVIRVYSVFQSPLHFTPSTPLLLRPAFRARFCVCRRDARSTRPVPPRVRPRDQLLRRLSDAVCCAATRSATWVSRIAPTCRATSSPPNSTRTMCSHSVLLSG